MNNFVGGGGVWQTVRSAFASHCFKVKHLVAQRETLRETLRFEGNKRKLKHQKKRETITNSNKKKCLSKINFA